MPSDKGRVYICEGCGKEMVCYGTGNPIEVFCPAARALTRLVPKATEAKGGA